MTIREGSALSRLPTYERRLDNGLTVLVREDRSAPVVAIVTHVRAGYFDEPEPIVGISHVLEHMYFKGTERRGAGDIARETKGSGGYLNAGTIYDHTSYVTVLPSSAVEQGLDIQADALLNSAIDEDELKRELLVIIQEAKRKLDTPAAVAQESLFETMFDVHRMRRWRIGTEAGLGRLTRADVWRYYRNLYRPPNVVLVVAGDVVADEVFGLVERHYGAMPAGEPVRDAGPEEPARRGFRFREMTGETVHTHVMWGWHTPGALHADTPALDLLAVVLGEGRASRLYREVREAGLVTRIAAYNYTPGSIGVFGASAELEPARTLAALRAMGGVLQGAQRIDAHELARARNILEARIVRRLETAEGQATLLADWQALGDWRLLDDYVDRIFRATPEEVAEAAGRYLEPDLATLLVYRPESAAPVHRDTDQLRRDLFEAVAGVADTYAGPAVVSAPEPAPPSAGRRVHGARVDEDVHFYEADGLTIVVKPRRSSPLVSIALGVRGGSVHEPAAQAGITSLMARASIKGTRTRSAARLAEETEALGGAIAPLPAGDLVQWTLTLPSRHFARGAELLADAALAPAFPEREVDRERGNALSDLERVRDDMAQYPVRLMLGAAFAGHPYGFTLETLEAGTRTLDAHDLAVWHDARVRRAAPSVLVVGDVEPERAADVTASWFEAQAARAAAVQPAPPAWPAQGRQCVVEMNKAQTALALGFPGPHRLHQDVPALRVLSAAISGLGGQLFEELRSRHSLAYSVAAYPVSRVLGGAFVAYIATSPEREQEARERLLSALLALRDRPIAEDELLRAKRYTIGAWQIQAQTNAAQLDELGRVLMLGGGLERIRTFEQRINAVTPAAILEAVQRWFDPARLVEGVVRGRGGGR